EHRVERGEGGERRGVVHGRGAHDVQHGQDLLGREEAVRHQAHEEGRDDRGNGGGAVGRADLRARKVQRGTQVGGKGHVPRSPEEVLHEHHRGQLQPDRRFHQRSSFTRTLRKATSSSWFCSPIIPSRARLPVKVLMTLPFKRTVYFWPVAAISMSFHSPAGFCGTSLGGWKL